MRAVILVGLIASGAALASARPMHLTLVDSRPRDDAVVTEPPTQIWLRFNEPVDLARCGISVRGPGGGVRLGPVALDDSVSITAAVLESLEPGEYTVSWLAAAPDDHPVRGRYSFTVEAAGRRR